MSKAERIPVIECTVIPSTLSDCVTRVQRIGGMTHVVFCETRPSSDGHGKERVVVSRMAFPNDVYSLIARTMLAGASTPDWVMPGEDDWLGLHTEH